jgi:dienelactone hydrolase
MMRGRRPGGALSMFPDAFLLMQQVWPQGVPVQVHGMDADPFFIDDGDIDAARALIAEAEDGELFLYPGDQHYFADSSLPSYDAEASALLLQRVIAFLAVL